MALQDQQVQDTLAAAILIIKATLEQEKDEFVETKLNVLFYFLTHMRQKSKSANGIPGQRGLGLEEAVAISESIILQQKVDGRTLSFTMRGAFQGTSLRH